MRSVCSNVIDGHDWFSNNISCKLVNGASYDFWNHKWSGHDLLSTDIS